MRLVYQSSGRKDRRMTDDDRQLGQQRLEQFLRGLYSHIVCLTGTYVPLNPAGCSAGPESFFNYSGFVFLWHGEWILMPAGKVLKKINDLVTAKKVDIRHCHLADYYGLQASHHIPIPFNIADALKIYLDDEEIAVDVGMVPLSSHYQRLLES